MKIHVRGFGKIESADIDMSNLVIFVGENNSGKTYLMQLIYGLFSFFNTNKFSSFLESYKFISDNDNDFIITSDNTDFYQNLQNELNSFINKHKNEIIQNTFHTKALTIDTLSVEFSPLLDNYSIVYTKASDSQLHELYEIHKNNEVLSQIGYYTESSTDSVEYARNIKRLRKKEFISYLLTDLFGIKFSAKRKRKDDTPLI